MKAPACDATAAVTGSMQHSDGACKLPQTASSGPRHRKSCRLGAAHMCGLALSLQPAVQRAARVQSCAECGGSRKGPDKRAHSHVAPFASAAQLPSFPLVVFGIGSTMDRAPSMKRGRDAGGVLRRRLHVYDDRLAGPARRVHGSRKVSSRFCSFAAAKAQLQCMHTGLLSSTSQWACGTAGR